MEVKFLQDVIIISDQNTYQYIYLAGAVFWIVACFSGLFAFRSLDKKPSIGLTLFTFVSFFPFSYLCYDSYKSPSSIFHYAAKIDAKENTVSFGDSREIEDVTIPFSDWKSYIITSETVSDKNSVRYKDTIHLEHKNGFYLPLTTVSVTKSEGFSRYAELNRELRRFSKIFPLPIHTVYGKKHPGVFLKINESKNPESSLPVYVPERKPYLPEIQLPLRWNYIVSPLAWGFFFLFLSFGHLGVLTTYVSYYHQKSVWLGLSILFIAYPIAFWIGNANIFGKKDMMMVLEETGSSYKLYSIRKGQPPGLESEVIKDSGVIAKLDLPSKTMGFLKSEIYQKALELAEKKDKGDLSGTFSDLGKIIGEGWKQQNWYLSDLPLEYTTALYFRFFASK